MPRTQLPNNELAILDRVFEPERPTLPPEAARAILAFDFSQVDKERMRCLSAKAWDGALTPDEQTEIDSYERVGHLLNLLQSKARRSLKGGRGTNGKTQSP